MAAGGSSGGRRLISQIVKVTMPPGKGIVSRGSSESNGFTGQAKMRVSLSQRNRCGCSRQCFQGTPTQDAERPGSSSTRRPPEGSFTDGLLRVPALGRSKPHVAAQPVPCSGQWASEDTRLSSLVIELQHRCGKSAASSRLAET